MTTQPFEAVRTDRKHQPPYKVLLHNDDLNSMDHVIQALLKTLPQLTTGRAREIMFEAHTSGVALVIVTHREPAEFYQESLQLQGLTVTLEPAE